MCLAIWQCGKSRSKRETTIEYDVRDNKTYVEPSDNHSMTTSDRQATPMPCTVAYYIDNQMELTTKDHRYGPDLTTDDAIHTVRDVCAYEMMNSASEYTLAGTDNGSSMRTDPTGSVRTDPSASVRLETTRVISVSENE